MHRKKPHVITLQHGKDRRGIQARQALPAPACVRVAAGAARLFVRTVAIVLGGHAGRERRHQIRGPGLCGDSPVGAAAEPLAVVHPGHQDSAHWDRFPGAAAKHLQRDRARHVRVPRNVAGDTASISLVCARARRAQLRNRDAFSLAKRNDRAYGPRTSRADILVCLQRCARSGCVRRTGGCGDSQLRLPMRSPLAEGKKPGTKL